MHDIQNWRVANLRSISNVHRVRKKQCWRWQRLGRCKLANSRVWCSSGQRQPLVIHHHRESPMTSVACLTHKYNRTSIIAHKFYQCVPCPIVFSRFMKAVEGVSHLGRRLWVCLYPWLRDKPCPPPNIILLISCMDLSFDWQLQLSIAYVARTRQRTNKHSNYSCINRSRDMALHTCFSQRVPHCCEKTPPRSPPPTNGIRWKPEQRF
jgi:hypothetical protein